MKRAEIRVRKSFLFVSEPKYVLAKLSALEYVEEFSLGCGK